MMGHQPPPQDNLFSYGVSLDQRVRANHPLRKVEEVLDLEFTYNKVKDFYGYNGQVSVPPPVIVKLMLLLVLYNVRSERELMATVPERLDWLWFLGYTLETPIPDHSVLSKARRRWGPDLFKELFERVILQCAEAGLVDGSKVFVDSSLVDADASNNSVVDTHSLRRHLNKSYRELEKRLAEVKDDEGSGSGPSSGSEVNKRYVSTTDPDAAIVRRGTSRLRYQFHRAVDPKAEVITATDVTAGDVNEAHRMVGLMDSHQNNTGMKAETIVADSKYGTIENLLDCKDRGVRPHMPALKDKTANSSSRAGIFPETAFEYDESTDTYRCPGGNVLQRKKVHPKRNSVDYGASRRDCAACELKSRCTRNRDGRTVKRHFRQQELEAMLEVTRSSASKRDIKTRQHLMERSFGRGYRYGMKRARWRRLRWVTIQEYLTATVQNIETLIRYGSHRLSPAVACAAPGLKGGVHGGTEGIWSGCLETKKHLASIRSWAAAQGMDCCTSKSSI
jgi:transposase